MHVTGVVTVNTNESVVLPPPLSKAVAFTVYVPAGKAFVIRTTPVDGSPVNWPLKLVDDETFNLDAFTGATPGVTVMLAPRSVEMLG